MLQDCFRFDYRIKLKQDKGVTKFYLMENNLFDSLYSLIVHYRQNPLRSSVSYGKQRYKVSFVKS